MTTFELFLVSVLCEPLALKISKLKLISRPAPYPQHIYIVAATWPLSLGDVFVILDPSNSRLRTINCILLGVLTWATHKNQ